jgi:hypothetical protein
MFKVANLSELRIKIGRGFALTVASHSMAHVVCHARVRVIYNGEFIPLADLMIETDSVYIV